MRFLSLLAGLLLLANSAIVTATDPTAAIVVITTDRGAGTGFVCEMGGTNYLVTNVHVIEGAQRFQFRTLEQTALVGMTLELANDRDLARLRLDSAPATILPVATTLPKHNDPVTVLGNSGGAGVVTKLTGKVVGIGPMILEVDAAFVSGNSGSPILNAAGKVVGIATFVSRPGVTNNWISAGTRFNETRRFGARIDGVTWVPVTPRQLYQQSSVLRDCEVFLRDTGTMLDILRDPNPQQLTEFIAAQKGADKRYFDPQYPQMLNSVCHNLRTAMEGYDGGLDPRSTTVQSSLRMARMSFQQLPTTALAKLRGTQWSTQFYKDKAVEIEKVFTQWSEANKAR